MTVSRTVLLFEILTEIAMAYLYIIDFRREKLAEFLANVYGAVLAASATYRNCNITAVITFVSW